MATLSAHRPVNRHATHSTCSQMFTTVRERKEQAAKLLRAVELGQEKTSLSRGKLMHNKSVELSIQNRHRESNSNIGQHTSFDQRLNTADSTNAIHSKGTLVSDPHRKLGRMSSTSTQSRFRWHSNTQRESRSKKPLRAREES